MKKTTTPKKNKARKPRLNIYQRIAYVQQNVGSVLKLGGLGDEYEYTFAYEKDVIAEVKPLLAKIGILILNDLVESKDLENGITKVRMQYTLINLSNTADRHVSFMEGTGQDLTGTTPGDKGLPKAVTMANKYYLAKTFQMPIGGDAESEKRAKAKKDGKQKEVEDPEAAYKAACKVITTTRNIDGLNQYAEELKTSKLFDTKQKADLTKRITERVNDLQNAG